MSGVVVPQGTGGVAVPLRGRRGRGILAATVIGSGMTFLDATIANIAAARIGHDFDATFGQLQWVINGYTLTLAALILLGGALGDRLGRRRVFMVGVAWFALASLGCALAPDISWLVGLRAVQGVGAALMMPGSLAILQAVLAEEDRAAAVGAWSGLTGVASAAGPLVGGWFVQSYSWRLAFAINVPLAVVTLVLAWRSIPETRGGRSGRADVLGTVTVAAGLAAVTYGTTSAGTGWGPRQISTTAVGAVLLLAFAALEVRLARQGRTALVPVRLFRDRVFAGTNAMTLLTYGAMGVFLFLLVLDLQVTGGYGALPAGLATLPVTVLLLLFSARVGRLAARIGPRLPLVAGPLLAAAGLALSLRIDEQHHGYVSVVLPAVTVFALGLTLIVAPLTATVMGAAPAGDVGIASAVNNAVARTGGLLAVAVIPPLAGLHGEAYRVAETLTHAYRWATLGCVGLLVVSALIIALTVGRAAPRRLADETTG